MANNCIKLKVVVSTECGVVRVDMLVDVAVNVDAAPITAGHFLEAEESHSVGDGSSVRIKLGVAPTDSIMSLFESVCDTVEVV